MVICLSQVGESWCKEVGLDADSLPGRSLPVLLYAGDREEPPHVHVEREDNMAKFWLDPIRLQGSGGFPRTEISRIRKFIRTYPKLLEAWHEYFFD